jgi:adenylate cyclase
VPDHDALLAKAIQDAGNVVTGFALTNAAGGRKPAVAQRLRHLGDDPLPFIPDYAGAVDNLPAIESAAAGNGSISFTTDSDFILRRVPLVERIGSQLYPTLAAEALRVAQGAHTVLIKSTGASGEYGYGNQKGIVSIKIGHVIVPTDAEGAVLIHFTPPCRGASFRRGRCSPTISIPRGAGFHRADRHQRRGPARHPAVADRSRHARSRGACPGARADAAGALSRTAGLGARRGILFRADCRQPADRRAAHARRGVVGRARGLGDPRRLRRILACLYANLMLFDPVTPSVAAFAVYLSSTIIGYLRTEAEKRQVRGAFGQYLSPALVEELTNDPARLKLGGDLREMTFLFCDVRGFTRISEHFKSNPQGLTGF